MGVITLCLFSCSNESDQATRSDNSGNQAATFSNDRSLTKPEPTIQSPVKVIGDFTNVKSDGEHQWGYSVEIWKQDNSIYGLFSGGSLQLVGDPPTGILIDSEFDERSGKFSFRTKLPSYTYDFDGILTKRVLKGRLSNITTNESKEIVLKRSKEWSSEMMDEYASYEDWKKYADEILKFRGPRP